MSMMLMALKMCWYLRFHKVVGTPAAARLHSRSELHNRLKAISVAWWFLGTAVTHSSVHLSRLRADSTFHHYARPKVTRNCSCEVSYGLKKVRFDI
jgi:hypothetical protein